MGLEIFLFQKKAWGQHNDCLLCKNLMAVDRDRITSQLKASVEKGQ